MHRSIDRLCTHHSGYWHPRNLKQRYHHNDTARICQEHFLLAFCNIYVRFYCLIDLHPQVALQSAQLLNGWGKYRNPPILQPSIKTHSKFSELRNTDLLKVVIRENYKKPSNSARFPIHCNTAHKQPTNTMKAFTILSIAATALCASAQNFTFRVTDLNNKSIGNLTSLHSGAGFNYFFVNYPDPTPEMYYLDSENVAQLEVEAPYPYLVGTLGNFLAVGPSISPMELSIVDGQVMNHEFTACFDVSDPYNYSKKYRAIVFNQGEVVSNESDCIPVRLFVDPQVNQPEGTN